MWTHRHVYTVQRAKKQSKTQDLVLQSENGKHQEHWILKHVATSRAPDAMIQPGGEGPWRPKRPAPQLGYSPTQHTSTHTGNLHCDPYTVCPQMYVEVVSDDKATNRKLKIMYIVHGSLTEPQLGFQLHHKPPSVAVSRKPELPHSTGQCKVPYPRPPNPARCRKLPQSLYSLLEKEANKVQYFKHGRFAAYWLFFTIVRAERVRKSLRYLGRCSKMAGL